MTFAISFSVGRMSDRANRDEALRPEIQRVFDANWQVYGVRKVCRQLQRNGFDVGCCSVGRLIEVMGIQSIVRSKPHETTIPEKTLPCPLHRVNRQFRVPAPNMPWISDFRGVYLKNATCNGPAANHPVERSVRIFALD